MSAAAQRREVEQPTSVAVLAHRGLHTTAAENSRAAFQQVVAAAATGIPLSIEFDIRRTACGTAVITHDEDFSGVFLDQVTHRQLERCFGSDAPMTLEEAVAILAPSDVPLIDAEIKEDGHTAEVLSILAPVTLDRLLVSSFEAPIVAEVKRLAPEVRTGLLIDELDGGWRLGHTFLKAMLACQADTLIPWYEQLSRGLTAQVRKLGKGVGVYTVDDPEILSELVTTGSVDWICTDRPEFLLPELLQAGHRLAV